MRNTRWKFVVGALTFACAGIAAAQNPPEPADTPDQLGDETSSSTDDPIVVSGQASDLPKVILGSRIPRTQRIDFGSVATSTGTRGLTPQSGMDQGASVRTIRTVNCVSDDGNLSTAARCIMADAQSAYENGQLEEAGEKFNVITDNRNFSPEERLAAAQWEYRIADEMGDLVRREYALLEMVWTGAMEPSQAASGHRTLSSWALKRGDRSLAQTRLRDLDSTGLANANDLANLAILSRELGETRTPQSDSEIMLRAISHAQANDQAVPPGWHDFASATHQPAKAQ